MLKNPWDFLNFMYVKEAFPNSKFIFIHRHPLKTINSQLKAMRSLLNIKNEYVALVVNWYNQIFRQPLRLHFARFLFSSHFGLGPKIAIRHVMLATGYFMKHIHSLSQKDYICVRYEDLCKEPSIIIAKILDWLGLKDNSSIEYEPFIDVQASPLLSEVKRNQDLVLARIERYLEFCGY